jgi:hypothetical protein
MDITPRSKVGEILDCHPETEAVFTRLGFTELKNPLLRRTVAKFATLQIACEKKKLPVETLVDELNKAIKQGDGK